MWWNIIPSWVITGGLIYIPAVATSAAAFVYTGTIHNRDRKNIYDYYMILRDQRVMDGADPYKQLKPDGGLGNLKLDD